MRNNIQINLSNKKFKEREAQMAAISLVQAQRDTKSIGNTCDIPTYNFKKPTYFERTYVKNFTKLNDSIDANFQKRHRNPTHNHQ